MSTDFFKLESNQLFSKSKIWQLNRAFYQYKGINAFSEDIVPHHLTSNSLVGKTYAELILGFLKDLAAKGKTKEKVFIIELGAGHGRLAFHILSHLQKLISNYNLELPPFCYILSDIAEKNLNFFQAHHQFQEYFDNGTLDLCYFDAIESKQLFLRNAQTTINPKELDQPIVAIANYFFDSIPSELFLVRNKELSSCSLSITSKENPERLNPEELIKSISLKIHHSTIDIPFYSDSIINEVLEEYKSTLLETYLFYPEKAMNCIKTLNSFSNTGLLLLSMDKGFHELHDLENRKEPDVVKHGSFSIWVNYHALAKFCHKQGGKALFPSLSTFHLELGALMFMEGGESYYWTHEAYQKFVNDFGPDDFNTIKHLSYFNLSRLSVKEIIALTRLSVYDSTFFIKLLPRLKELSKAISFNERKRIFETIEKVWEMYFSIGEAYDFSYEIATLFYELGFYNKALHHFRLSLDLSIKKPDTYYNIALCYYQLRNDQLFFKTILEARSAFPEYELFDNLELLDMS